MASNTFLISSLSLLLVSCASLNPFAGGDEDQEPAKSSPQAVDPEPSRADSASKQQLEDLELKHSRLWTRVDEMEAELARQKELVAVLEQSLNLGLKPIQLRSSDTRAPAAGTHDDRRLAPPFPAAASPSSHTAPSAAPSVGHGASNPAAASAAAGGNPGGHQVRNDAKERLAASAAPQANPEFEQLFAEAHEQYMAGKYGPAILKLAEIEREFGGDIAEGLHIYWIGRCWLGLKEYTTARSRFEDFIRSHGESPYVARAKVDLAKAEYGAGLFQSALKRLEDVITHHPYEDAAELARFEIAQMKKSL